MTSVPIVSIDPASPDDALVSSVAKRLRQGALVAIPTETVYGLGVNAFDTEAIEAVFVAKGRPSSDPLIVHVDSIEMARSLVDGELSNLAVALAEAFWPGPLTMILPKHADVPDSVTSGGSTVGIRMPAHPVVAALITAAGVPVAAPSANRFGRISPTTARHVSDELGDRIDLIVDGGACEHGVESTVVSVADDAITVLRHGAITMDQLAAFAAVRDATSGSSGSRQAAPGHAVRHYSPGCVTLASTTAPIEPFDGRAVFAGLGDTGSLPTGWTAHRLGSRTNLEAVAHRLYDNLRRIDEASPDLLVVELTGQAGLGRAIDDRLTRAASGQVAHTDDELVGLIARVCG